MAETTKTSYIEAVGKRKSAIARVRLTKASKTSLMVNNKTVEAYFPTEAMQVLIKEAFAAAPDANHFSITVLVRGGGLNAQAESVRHGIARALVKTDAALRTPLKKAKLLTRDARIKERRKFGLKKARKSPQWSKR